MTQKHTFKELVYLDPTIYHTEGKCRLTEDFMKAMASAGMELDPSLTNTSGPASFITGGVGGCQISTSTPGRHKLEIKFAHEEVGSALRSGTFMDKVIERFALRLPGTRLSPNATLEGVTTVDAEYVLVLQIETGEDRPPCENCHGRGKLLRGQWAEVATTCPQCEGE